MNMHLLRHGQTVLADGFRGQVDTPLSPAGLEQMWQAVGDRCGWQAVVSSPLSRCCDFAGRLADRYDLPLQLEPRLMEMNFGLWDGRTSRDVAEEFPAELAAFYENPANTVPPGGESLQQLQARVEQWLTEYLGNCDTTDHALVVTHGGPIRILLAHCLAMPLSAVMRLDISYASRVNLEFFHADDGMIYPRVKL